MDFKKSIMKVESMKKETLKEKIKRLEKELEQAQLKDNFQAQLKLGDRLRNLKEELSNCKHPFGWKEVKRFRHYFPMNETFGGKCPKCKSVYAVELLDNPKVCPECNVELKPAWEMWSEIQCLLCNKRKIHQGIIRRRI